MAIPEHIRTHLLTLPPDAFLFAWQHAYREHCRAGPWQLHPHWMAWAAIEQDRQWPMIYRHVFGPAVGYQVRIPFPVGSLHVWWYRRRGKHRGESHVSA